MRVLVVYESMYGNTHTVAAHIAQGLAAADRIDVVPVGDATPEAVAAADLLVVGGPTHIHGLSTEATREQALTPERLDRGDDIEVDPDAEGPGLRDWFDQLQLGHRLLAAAFDTRSQGSPLLTGRASKGIRRRLRHHGCVMVTEPESFVVASDQHLVDGEADRAVAWGRSLLAHVAERAARGGPGEDGGPDVLGDIIESGGRFEPPT